jgi:hypothetical protein
MGSLALEASGLSGRVALIAAQTRADRVLISGDGFVDLGDYARDIEAIADTHDLLLISPHPHAANEIPGLGSLLKIPSVRITTANSYRMLATGRLTRIVAISSSLIEEAKYFGVHGERLSTPNDRSSIYIRAQSFGNKIADIVARLCGFDLPSLEGASLPPGAVVRQLLGINWAADGITNAADVFPAVDLNSADCGMMRCSDPRFAPALVFGWHAAEDWGVWGNGPVSALNFTWPESREAPLACVLEICVFVEPDRLTKALDIWIDGERVANILAMAKETVKVALEIDAPRKPGPVQILLTTKPSRPSESCADHPDWRLLGVGLVGFAWH